MVVTVCLAGVAGVSSFYVTRSLGADSVKSAQVCMRNWLSLTDEQDKAVRQSDPDFEAEATELSLAFIAERKQLARLLEVSNSTDEQITAQIEEVIAANHTLMRRVLTYVLAVRQHLLPYQQQRLMQMCGNIIQGRAGKRCLFGAISTAPSKKHLTPGKGCRCGSGQCGRGSGGGQDCRCRRRGGLSRNVEFTPEQLQMIQQLHPGFESKSSESAKNAFKEHELFASLLNTPAANDEVVLRQLERFLETRARLERLTSQRVLLIRSHLSAEQQRVLVGLCADCSTR